MIISARLAMTLNERKPAGLASLMVCFDDSNLSKRLKGEAKALVACQYANSLCTHPTATVPTDVGWYQQRIWEAVCVADGHRIGAALSCSRRLRTHLASIGYQCHAFAIQKFDMKEKQRNGR